MDFGLWILGWGLGFRVWGFKVEVENLRVRIWDSGLVSRVERAGRVV